MWVPNNDLDENDEIHSRCKCINWTRRPCYKWSASQLYHLSHDYPKNPRIEQRFLYHGRQGNLSLFVWDVLRPLIVAFFLARNVPNIPELNAAELSIESQKTVFRRIRLQEELKGNDFTFSNLIVRITKLIDEEGIKR